MLAINFIILIACLAVLIKSAGYAIKYSSRLAKILLLPEFIVSFFIIAIISVLPEASLSIISSIKNEAGLGLGTLLGSNIADLTLVFGIVALFSSGGIKVKSKILRNNLYYLILLLFPLILGFDGRFSRIDGLILILAGILFFIKIFIESKKFKKKFNHTPRKPFLKSVIFLVFSLAFLLASAFFVVKLSVDIADEINIPPVLIGLTVLALGTCLPELIFSIRAVKQNLDDLALGDILGTVITDATIIIGIMALISPFSFNIYTIYVTGTAMFLAGLFVVIFMKSNKTLNKVEGVILIMFYIVFIFVEFIINKALF